MRVVISAGHGKYVRGAEGPNPWGLDEVDEARRVVTETAAQLTAQGAGVTTYFDDISKSQNENLNRIVDFHNAQTRDLDISVHFNAYQNTSKPMGTEVLYVSKTGSEFASEVVDAICAASGLLNRGPKMRTDLFFLNNTAEPAILIEVCFVDSSADAEIYRVKFAQICAAIAKTISGEDVPEPEPGPEPIPPGPGQDCPTLRRGDKGPWVVYMQELLRTVIPDGDFGPATESAVKASQSLYELSVDGICGPQTWNALQNEEPPAPPPDAFTDEEQLEITRIAANSLIAEYHWDDRGMAPVGYIEGMALAFGQVYQKLVTGDSVAMEMAKAKTDNPDKDALSWYAGFFQDAQMDNSKSGADTLRHLWALMIGLGMRESSGQHCEGRDMSADNVTSDTCEAGAFQTSYNAHTCSPQFDKIFEEYKANRWQGFLEVFSIDVSCSSQSWSCYGSGNGFLFQQMCKNLPAFAAESCAITLRNRRNHYGPINRYEVELQPEADDMLHEVQDYIDEQIVGV